MNTYDVIVVGGGIIGATTAAMLSERGADVALVERRTCAGAGASAYSGGIVRLYDADPLMMRLGAHALRARRTTSVGTAFDQAIRTTGVLYRAPEEELGTIVAAMEAEGPDYPHQILARDQLSDLTNFVSPRRDGVDLFEPRGGYGDVRYAVHVMAHIVRDRGTVIEHAEVRKIGALSGGGAEVRLADGYRLHSRSVVVAAGAWSGQLVEGLPTEARSIPFGLIRVARVLELPIIDIPAGTYAVPSGDGLIGIGCGPRAVATSPEDLPRMDESHRASSLAQLAALTGRSHAAEPVTVLRGFDAYTPDNRPILGFLDDRKTLYVISGLSGLGFKIAPAIADLAADAVRARLFGSAEAAGQLAEAFGPGRFAACADTIS